MYFKRTMGLILAASMVVTQSMSAGNLENVEKIATNSTELLTKLGATFLSVTSGVLNFTNNHPVVAVTIAVIGYFACKKLKQLTYHKLFNGPCPMCACEGHCQNANAFIQYKNPVDRGQHAL